MTSCREAAGLIKDGVRTIWHFVRGDAGSSVESTGPAPAWIISSPVRLKGAEAGAALAAENEVEQPRGWLHVSADTM